MEETNGTKTSKVKSVLKKVAIGGVVAGFLASSGVMIAIFATYSIDDNEISNAKVVKAMEERSLMGTAVEYTEEGAMLIPFYDMQSFTRKILGHSEGNHHTVSLENFVFLVVDEYGAGISFNKDDLIISGPDSYDRVRDVAENQLIVDDNDGIVYDYFDSPEEIRIKMENHKKSQTQVMNTHSSEKVKTKVKA